MAGWRTSSWYAGSYYNSTWYGGTGGGGASTATGGGTSVNLGLPPGWREITEKELRSSARRADARRRAKEDGERRKRAKSDPAKTPAPDPVVPAPAPSAEVDRLVDAVTGSHVADDIGARTRGDALAAALARARETAELAATERRAVVGKLVRRVVAFPSSRRTGIMARNGVRKAAPRIMEREEERRCEVHVDRRACVSTLTRLV